VLAREDAELGYPEVHLGFVPALVMTILRRKVGEGRAFELVARGRSGYGAARRADRPRERGLLRGRRLRGRGGSVGARARGAPPGAVALTKRLLYELGELDFEEGLERAARVNVEARMSEECREGVRRFLDR
jgi:methylglutaconyl-CoA hydratase